MHIGNFAYLPVQKILLFFLMRGTDDRMISFIKLPSKIEGWISAFQTWVITDCICLCHASGEVCNARPRNEARSSLRTGIFLQAIA
jgi:hypothetical protein